MQCCHKQRRHISWLKFYHSYFYLTKYLSLHHKLRNTFGELDKSLLMISLAIVIFSLWALSQGQKYWEGGA